MQPGAYLAVLANGPAVGIEGRLAGLELRDTILVLRPGPTTGFVFLFRKPLTEPTVAAQVRVSSTGAMNIDACRVASGENRGRPRGTFPHSDDAWGNGHLTYTESHAGGRWPPNLLLVHASGCVPGTARMQGHRGYKHGPGGSSSQFSQKGTATTRTAPWAGHADTDGMETVPAWACVAGCPVPLLETRSEASRFFPQFKDDAELLDWLAALVATPPGELPTSSEKLPGQKI